MASPHRRNEGKSRWRLGVFAGVVGVAQACSLFIPFEDYPGTGAPVGDGPDEAGVTGEGGASRDGGASDASDASDASCVGVDLRSDPANCGACGRACIDGGMCTVGRCPIDVIAAPDAGAIVWMDIGDVPGATGEQYLYFTTARGSLNRLKLDASDASVETAPTNAATGVVSVRAGGANGIFEVNGGVAWFKAATFKTDATPLQVANRPGIGPLRYEGVFAFWGDPSGLSWRVVNNTAPDAAAVGAIATPPPVAFATTTPNRILWTTDTGRTYDTSSELPGSEVVLIDGGTPGTSCMEATPTSILLCQKSQGILVYSWDRARVTTKFERQLGGIDDPEALLVDSPYMYIVDFAGAGKADLRRANVTGAGASMILAHNVGASRALAVSGGFVYFADGANIVRTVR